MQIQFAQRQKSSDEVRTELIKEYLFKAIRLSQFKKLQKQIDDIQYQQIQAYVYLQENLQCPYNNLKLAEFFCCNKLCKQFPIICGQQQCPCRKSHSNCSIILAEPFLNRVSEKICQPLNKDLLQYFEAKFYIYEFMMDRISQQQYNFGQWCKASKNIKSRESLYLYGFDNTDRAQCFQSKVYFGEKQDDKHKKCGCVPIDFKQQFIKARFNADYDKKSREKQLQQVNKKIKNIYSKILDKFDQKLENLQSLRQCANLNVAQFQIVKFLKRNNKANQKEFCFQLISQEINTKQKQKQAVRSTVNNTVFGATFLRAKQYQRGKLNSESVYKYMTLQKIKQKWRRSLKYQFSRFIQGSACFQPELLVQQRQYFLQTYRNSVQKLKDRIDWLQEDACENQYRIMQQPLDLDVLKLTRSKYEQIRAVVAIFQSLNLRFPFACWQAKDHQYLQIYYPQQNSKQRLLELRKISRNQVKLDTYNVQIIIKRGKLAQFIFSRLFINTLEKDKQDKLINLICKYFPYLQKLNQSNQDLLDEQLRRRASFKYPGTDEQGLCKNYSKELSNLKHFKRYFIETNTTKQYITGIREQEKADKLMIQQIEGKPQQINQVQAVQQKNEKKQQNQAVITNKGRSLQKKIKKTTNNKKANKSKIQKEARNQVLKLELSSVQKMTNLNSIIISQSMLSDQLIKVLSQKAFLKQVTMQSCIDGSDLVKLLENKLGLKTLNISYANSLSDKALQKIQKLCSKIQHFSISQSISIQGSIICQMKNLKFLKISQMAAIDPNKAANGIGSLLLIQHLDISKNSWVNDHFMNAVACSLSRLQFINCQSTSVTDDGLFNLYRTSQLKSLLCGFTKVTGQGIQQLSKYCTKISSLSIRGLNGQQHNGLVKQQDIFRVSHNIRLTHLDIRNCFGIKMILLKLHRLKTLWVSHSLFIGDQLPLFEEKGVKIIQF